MSPALHHECTRVPVTALASVGPLLLVAEGPWLRFYHSQTSDDFCILGTCRVFRDQAIHGIAVDAEGHPHVVLAIWGGPLARFLEIDRTMLSRNDRPIDLDGLHLFSTTRAHDWILDLSFGPAIHKHSTARSIAVCAAVTAHNALVELTLENSAAKPDGKDRGDCLSVDLRELTSSSRSILYSAHLLWDSSDHILVAAGTAFGEIMFWSWIGENSRSSYSHIHRVFLGHEGSIFGVRISREFQSVTGQKQRLLASCSDDRTIRIWDISGNQIEKNTVTALEDGPENQRTGHTGFSNASFDADTSSSACFALGWGHLSRVWAIKFLDSRLNGSAVSILSAGEDATSRVWEFTPAYEEQNPGVNAGPIKLMQVGLAAYHNGKHIWSTALHGLESRTQMVICGGADSKITSHLLSHLGSGLAGKHAAIAKEYTMHDLDELSKSNDIPISLNTPATHKSSKAVDFFRSYAFVDGSNFLLTTNSGKALLESLHDQNSSHGRQIVAKSRLLVQLEELRGYSVCAAESSLGVGFLAGPRGTIYIFQQGSSQLIKIHTVQGKIGSMFTCRVSSSPDIRSVVLLITLMGRSTAQLLYVDIADENSAVLCAIDIPISGLLTGLTITSMTYVPAACGDDYLYLGFRNGSVAVYSLMPSDMINHEAGVNASLFRIIRSVHGKDTVTAMRWIPTTPNTLTGNLLSVGRDGCCAMHHIDLARNSIFLVHHLSLPIGPNIEGLYYHNNHLLVYGFSSTKFVVYDTTTEEEIMNVETGGSHRSWAFQPSPSEEGGGTLVWTRASSMHVCSQNGPNHQVIRPGGHGREIKAVAVSNSIDNRTGVSLIATGAEDTDIKIFEYRDGDLICRRTLRKHTTGIQHLQWSEDGEYLFSSGGCEEFYIWRARHLPAPLGLGVVCELICKPESEHSDLRIMSFDVRKRREPEAGYIIAMIFSDSTVRVYSYDPTAAVKWHVFAKGIYFTSCLTQSVFLSPTTVLTTGTDGHAVLWPLPTELHRPHASTPSPPATLTWEQPARIHQNTSKTLSSHTLNNGSKLLASGGDDGSLSFLLTAETLTSTPTAPSSSYTHPPIILVRAHASAITACTILPHQDKIHVITSGNDQWIRLWEVTLNSFDAAQDPLTIKRVKKARTNVADVSSMAILEQGEAATKVIICGVGMEVLCLDWEE